MKGFVESLIAVVGLTLWTAFSLGACAFAIHYGWSLVI